MSWQQHCGLLILYRHSWQCRRNITWNLWEKRLCVRAPLRRNDFETNIQIPHLAAAAFFFQPENIMSISVCLSVYYLSVRSRLIALSWVLFLRKKRDASFFFLFSLLQLIFKWCIYIYATPVLFNLNAQHINLISQVHEQWHHKTTSFPSLCWK